MRSFAFVYIPLKKKKELFCHTQTYPPKNHTFWLSPLIKLAVDNGELHQRK